MPYFSHLQKSVLDVSEWADMRQEQGFKVTSIIRRVERELDRARNELSAMQPTAAMLEQEPNDLESIRALRPQGPGNATLPSGTKNKEANREISVSSDRPRRLWDTFKTIGLRDRMKGAWLGRAAGCTLGAPVEGWEVDKIEKLAHRCGVPFPPIDFWPDHPAARYTINVSLASLKGQMKFVPTDDDLAYTILGLLILERYGLDFTTEDVAEMWLEHIPIAWSAEEVTIKNLNAGIPPAKAADKNNPYQEWIGADIRSDPWAYAAPGWPEKAAEFAYRDASLSHRQNGIYGAMFFAAAISAAFAVDDPIEALRIGLTEIPQKCRLANDVTWALETGPSLKDWRDARQKVDERFGPMSEAHTNNNACLTVFGLVLGNGNFTKTIGNIVAMGLDNDCTAATAGSLLGAVVGIKNIPAHWWKPFRNRTKTYLRELEWFSNTDLVNRFIAMARKTWNDSSEKRGLTQAKRPQGV